MRHLASDHFSLCRPQINESIDTRYSGPATVIPAVSFDRVLSLPEPMLDKGQSMFKDKVLFVGYAETSQAEQSEHFSTVYSRADGIDLSGVEIAATAFSNLMDDSAIQQ